MAAKRFCLAFLLVAAQCINPQLGHADQQQTERLATSKPTASDTSDTDPLPPGAIARLGTTRFRPTHGAKAIRFLQDGKTLITATSDGRMEYWDAESGVQQRDMRLSTEGFHEAAITPDGRFIAGRGFYLDPDGAGLLLWAALYETKTGRELHRWRLKKSRQVDYEPVTLSADGSTIAFDDRTDVNIVYAFDLATGSEGSALRQGDQAVQSLALSPDGDTLAIGSPGVVSLWKWKEEIEPKSVPITDTNSRDPPRIHALTFTADGSRLAVRIGNGISWIDPASGKEIRHIKRVGWGAFSDDGRLLVGPAPSLVPDAALWNLETGNLVMRLETPFEGARFFAISPNNRLVAGVHDYSSEMCVWDTQTGERRGQHLVGHWYPPVDLRFLPGDERLASSSHDSRIFVWNVQSSQAERLFEHKPTENDRRRSIRALEVSPDGRYLASSGFDNTVRVWDVNAGQEQYRLPGHRSLGGHRSLCFTADGKRLASWGDDMRVNVFEVATGKAIVEYELAPTSVKIPDDDSLTSLGDQIGLQCGAFSPDATRLVVALAAVHVFDTMTGRELFKSHHAVGSTRDLLVTPNNRFLLMFGTNVEVRELANGRLVANRIGMRRAAAVTTDDSGQRAALALDEGDPRIVIVKIPELTEIGRIDGLRFAPRALRFSHSGKLLAASARDTSVVIYDLEKSMSKH